MCILKSYDENFILKTMCKKLYLEIIFTCYNFSKVENCTEKIPKKESKHPVGDRALRAALARAD